MCFSVNLLFWYYKLHDDYGEMIVYGYCLWKIVSIITPVEAITKKIVYIINMHLFSWKNCLLLFHPRLLCGSLSINSSSSYPSSVTTLFYNLFIAIEKWPVETSSFKENYKFWESVVDGRIAGLATQSSLPSPLRRLQHKCVCPVGGASTDNKMNLSRTYQSASL